MGQVGWGLKMHFFSEGFPAIASMQAMLSAGDLAIFIARLVLLLCLVAVAARLSVEVLYLVHKKILEPWAAGSRLRKIFRDYLA